jgi:hypothetical protein
LLEVLVPVLVLVPVPVPMPMLMHGGSRKTDHPRKLAHRRKCKRKFGKNRDYYFIDMTAFHIWSFERDDFISTGKLGTASIFGHH